jgi:hypothetical protein
MPVLESINSGIVDRIFFRNEEMRVKDMPGVPEKL